MTTHKTWSADEKFQIVLEGPPAPGQRRRNLSASRPQLDRLLRMARARPRLDEEWSPLEGGDPRDGAPPRERSAEEARRRLRHRQRRAARAPRGVVAGEKLWTAPPRPYAETRGHLVTSLRHYNEERPHSSLNYLTPTEYAKKVKEEA